MKIKSLTVKLAALLCACGLAFSAQADNVAQIGEVEYATLSDAIAAAEGGDTVQLLADVEVSSSTSLSKTLTIDLNGYTITSSAILFNIYNSSVELTITDSSANGTGAIDVSANKIVYVSSGKFTLEGGALSVHSSSSYTYGVQVGSSGTFVMTGGSITIPSSSTSNYNYCVNNSGTTTITGGSMTAEASGGNYTINGTSGTIAISDGVFVAKAYPAGFKSPYVLYGSGTKTVTGGYFRAIGDSATYSTGHLVYGSASISGGYFGGTTPVEWPSSNHFATGFRMFANTDPETAADYPYAVVAEPVMVAKIGDIEYATLAEAVAAAKAGGTTEATTIKLLTDVALTETLELEWGTTLNKALTIDLDGHNITATDCRALYVKTGRVNIANNGSAEAGHGVISSVKTKNSAFLAASSVVRVGSTESPAQAAVTFTLGAGVTVSTDYCYGVTVFGNNGGNANSTGLTFYCEGTVAVTGAMPAVSGNGTAELAWSNITIRGTGVVTAANDYAIYHPQQGVLTVNGTVRGQGGIEMKAGKLTLGKGSVVEATGTPSHPGINNNGTSTSGYAVVLVENNNYKGFGTGRGAPLSNAATVIGRIAIVEDNAVESTKAASITISNGIFSESVPAEYCATTYEPTGPDSDGWYGVVLKSEYRAASITKNGKTTYYDTVAKAITGATAGDTVKLENDISGVASVSVGKTLTLDLNGHTLTTTTNGVQVNANNITLTITDSSATLDANGYETAAGTGRIVNTTNAALGVNNTRSGYTINVNAGTITGRNGIMLLGNGTAGSATLNVNGGTITGANLAITGNGTATSTTNYGGTVITINGGSISVADDVAIYQPQSGTLTVTGGTITGATAIYQKCGTLDITGGTITGTGVAAEYVYNGSGANATGDAIVIDNCAFPGGAPSAQIKDATIASDNGRQIGYFVYEDSAEGTVLAGSRYTLNTNDERTWLADSSVAGYSYKIGEIVYVAQIGTTKYETLAEAVAAAQHGETITLLANIGLTNRLFINAGATPAYAGTDNRYATTSENKALTIDMNGHNITSASNIALAGGSLTITGTGTIATTASGLAPVEVRGTGDLASKRTLTIGEGVTLDGPSYGLNVFGSNDAQKNVIDVTVNGTVNGTLFVLGNLKNAENQINIGVNGTVAAPASTGSSPNVGIALNGNAAVTVNVGAQVGGDSGIEVRAGSLTVNGGTITATASEYSYTANGSGSTTWGAAISVAQHTTVLPTAVTLNGGTLVGAEKVYVKEVNAGMPDVTVQATADYVASATIPDDYKWAETETTGVYMIVPKDYVAQIGTTKYESLAAAITASQAGDTITILQDVADAGNITLKAGVTLDGNGKTISGNSAVYVNVAGGTIQNVTFQNIHNAANNLSAVYARSLEGELVITECTFDRCDWDAIQVTPVTGAEITITENTFRDDTTDGIKQQRFVHIQSSAKSEQFSATVTDNVMLGETAQEALEVYYPASPDYVQLAGNYIEYSHKVCILTGDGTNANELAWPQRSQADIDDDDKMVVATIPSTYTSQFFTNLADAVAVAQAGDTIKLLADADLEETVVITKSLTVDLNGNNISATDCRALWIKSGEVALVTPDDVYGAVSATDDLGVEANPVFKSNSSVIRVGDSVANTKPAKLTIGENVHIETGYCYGVTVFGMNDDGNEGADIQLVVKNGATVCADGDQPAISGNGTNSLKPTAITIEEGASVEASYDYAIYHPGKGTLTINGSVEGLGGIEVKSGTVIIGEGAVITATSEDEPSHTLNNNGTSTVGYAIAAVGNPAYLGDPSVKISGGTITGTIIALSDDGSAEVGATIAVSSGLFSEQVPEAYCATGFKPTTEPDDFSMYTVEIAGEYDVEEVAVTVETQAAAEEMVAEAKTENIKLPEAVAAEIGTDSEAVKAYKDAFEYKVVDSTTETGKYDVVVTLKDAVKPVSTDSTMEEKTEIEIETIPGLYYSVETSDNVGFEGSTTQELAPEMATAGTKKLDISGIEPEESETVKYFKVVTTATSNGSAVAKKESKTFGVMKTATPATKLAIIAVPWQDAAATTDTGTVKVSSMIKTEELAEGTKIHVAKGEGGYNTWKLQGGKWVDLDAVVTETPGQEVEPAEGVDASAINVPQGGAFWVEQEDPKPIVMIGQVGEQPTTKTVTRGSNLCASPKGEAFDLNKITTATESDTIVVPVNSGEAAKIFQRKGGKWKYWKFTNGRGAWVEEDTEIPAGTGFWYNRTGSSTTIDWNAK